jgi:multicomponent Na+:H+ antiporter subunit D
MLLLAPLLIPLVTALLTAVLPSHPRLRRGLSLAGVLLLLGAALALLAAVGQSGRLSVALGDWPLPYAIEFAADGLSAALVLVAALLGFIVLLYQIATEPANREAPGLQPLFQGLMAAVMAVFLAADLFNLYVWFELLLMATLGLLLLGGRPWHAEAALKYFVLSLLGTLLMLAAVGLIYGATGQLNLGALAQASQAPAVAQGLTLYVVMLLLALLLKAGAFPLFAWLPASYHTLSPPLLALLGGLLTKVAIYVLLRLTGQVFSATPAFLYEALGWLAMLTLVTGVLGAAYHWDLRRILAFHIVSQIGYLLLGIALASPAGAAGTAFFLIHNILVKANLFLLAGLMWLSAGHPDLRRIGGLYPARPWLALLFLVNAFSLVGVPPSSGFWGKFLLVQEAFAQQRFLWGGLALGVGLLTLYSMSKIWLEGFWKPHPEPARLAGPQAQGGGGPRLAYAALTLSTLVVLALGLYPQPFIDWLQQATAGYWAGLGQA